LAELAKVETGRKGFFQNKFKATNFHFMLLNLLLVKEALVVHSFLPSHVDGTPVHLRQHIILVVSCLAAM
jgi:hypothetical protein